MAGKKKAIFVCRDVRVSADNKEIVKGVSIEVYPGEIHALMGPNGSGKSTLAAALAGHPSLVTTGDIFLQGEPIKDLPAHERARKGLFLGFQYPVGIPGVTVNRFLKASMEAIQNRTISLKEYKKSLSQAFLDLNIPDEFASRYINDGFSGGEKKRMEILQMLLLKPKIALLDEIDSGLDIDALKLVAKGINKAKDQGMAVLLVTHYQRILDYVTPNYVHVFKNGTIVKSGGPEQALQLEADGYGSIDSLRSHEKRGV